MNVSSFLTLAIVVEVMTGITKSVLVKLGFQLKDWVDQAISLAFSVMLAAFGKIDFFAIIDEIQPVDFNFPIVLGIIMSALVLSRGSNAVHDILKRLNPPREGQTRIW
ncbi:MAG TPA: hypothetical protein GXX30_06355 [Firmicutes bacterium]|nr:hypothetical protein [Candidatus Fermentithermobacillaceae bacterium]